MRRWDYKMAQANLEEIMDLADVEGPQVIMLNGEDCVVLVSGKAWDSVSRTKEASMMPRRSIVGLLPNGPKGEDFDVERSKALPSDTNPFDE